MMLSEKTRRTLQAVTTLFAGALGLILLRWTPVTGKGFLSYALLFAILVVLALVVFSGKRGGYWPDKHE